jgi:hypothetical protein
MIFLNRKGAGPDTHLEWKVRIFLLGAALAMAGVGLDSTLLTTLAIVVLVAGAALRFLPTGKGSEDSLQANDAGDKELDHWGESGAGDQEGESDAQDHDSVGA